MVILFLLAACATMSYNHHYEVAKEKDTIESYNKFIENHPEGTYTEEIKDRIKVLKEKRIFYEVKSKNTNIAYEEFVQKYPNSKFIKEAEKRLSESDEEAFIRTCCIGTIKAFQGFINSYPNSKYITLATDRIEFLKAENNGSLESYKKFITQYPKNPFIYEAITTFPVLWLNKTSPYVGVFIDTCKFIGWKGIFGGGKAKEEEIRDKAFNEFLSSLENIGIKGILLNSTEETNTDSIPVLLVLEYEEHEREREPYRSRRSSGLNGWVSGALHDATVNNLSGIIGAILFKSVESSYNISAIKNVKTGLVYYSNIPELSCKVNRIQMLRVIRSFNDLAKPSLLVAMNDRNQHVRKEAVMLYSKLTGKDFFGEDSSRWNNWWEEYWKFELNRYYNYTRGFSITLPKLWGLQEKEGNIAVKSSSIQNFGLIRIYVYGRMNKTVTAEEYLKADLEFLRSQSNSSDLELIGSGEITIDDIVSRWVSYMYDKNQYVEIRYYLAKHPRAYSIICTSRYEEFSKWQSMFEVIAQSFKFENIEK